MGCALGEFDWRGNVTLRPRADERACPESKLGVTCGVCAKVCPEGIDPRRPERGAGFNECSKCRACADVCPAHAIKMPLLPSKEANCCGSKPEN